MSQKIYFAAGENISLLFRTGLTFQESVIEQFSFSVFLVKGKDFQKMLLKLVFLKDIWMLKRSKRKKTAVLKIIIYNLKHNTCIEKTEKKTDRCEFNNHSCKYHTFMNINDSENFASVAGIFFFLRIVLTFQKSNFFNANEK